MPQLFQVLKCYKCSVFQVHQTKKSNKWQCKLCGEKQSLKRHYGIGTGKECRLHVQKLNCIRGEIDEENETIQLNKSSDEEFEVKNENIGKTSSCKSDSKWSNYIDITEKNQKLDADEKMFLGNNEVVLEVPVKKRKTFNVPKANCKPSDKTPIMNSFAETKELKYQQNETYYMPVHNSVKYVEENLAKNTYNIIPKINTIEKERYFHTEIEKSHNLREKVDNKRNIQDRTDVKTYVPPKVNKNSKWAQFADEQHESGENLISNRDNSSETVTTHRHISPHKTTTNLFTLCDENELDDVLDF